MDSKTQKAALFLSKTLGHNLFILWKSSEWYLSPVYTNRCKTCDCKITLFFREQYGAPSYAGAGSWYLRLDFDYLRHESVNLDLLLDSKRQNFPSEIFCTKYRSIL